MKKFDLVIDLRMLSHGGIGSYLRNLLPYFEASGLTIHKIESGPAIYSLTEQLMLPLAIPPCRLFWTPHFNVPLLPIRAERRLATIHDFYHLAFSDELTLPQNIYAKLMYSQAVRRSDHLIFMSEFARSEWQRFFPGSVKRFTIINPGPGNRVPRKPFKEVPGPFFLFVGSLKPHKNLELLLRAFERSGTEKHLLIAGKKEGFIRGIDLERMKIPPRVHFLGQISDPELVDLYSRAEALVFPSLYEGWGLPPIEAMRMGCPVIASRAASIPEACGDAAVYFDPHNVDELAQVLRTIDTDRAAYIARGFQRAESFSWEKAAKEHLDVFTHMLSKGDGACKAGRDRVENVE